MKRNEAIMKKRAFTLIELLVVIAIIAILAAILFPVFAQAKTAAKKTQSLSNLKNLDTAVQIYLSDVDDILPMSEYGQFDTHVTWATMIYPYVKNGTQTTAGSTVGSRTFANDGIFRTPANPRPEVTNASSSGQYCYGVHHTLFVNNYAWQPSWGTPPNPGVNATSIDQSADKIIMMEKGANNPGNAWNYPQFHDFQGYWVDKVLTVPNDPSTLFRDGVDVYTPTSTMFDKLFDTDCQDGVTAGKWECAMHARYRFSGTMPVTFLDGHAKTFKKGAIKWFQNIWVDKRGVNPNYQYSYLNQGWGRPPIW
jgi:prepilin-type N-terminal cleavage/methylation domain-containing protein